MELSSLSSDRARTDGDGNRKHSTHRGFFGGGGGCGGISQQPQQLQQPPQHQTKRLGRTPSSPSVFFSKVKERIREKVYETSAEWPHMAAIVQERRQRAADAFEARMSIRRQNVALGLCTEGDGHACDDFGGHRVRKVRVKTDQTGAGTSLLHHRASPSSSCGSNTSTSGFDKENAKLAFRRRSISEDTYNRQPSGSCSQRPEDRGGVVCSNDELRAIVFEHKLRRSPVAQKHQGKESSSLEFVQDSTMSCDSLSNHSTSSIYKSHNCREAGHFPPISSRESLPVFALPLLAAAQQQHQDRVTDIINSGNNCPVSFTITSADDGKSTEDLEKLDDRTSDGTPPGDQTRRNSVVIREVVFDEYGQTWDIYGAEFDPEILGQAIQSHLEKIMKKKMMERSSKILEAEPVICQRSDSPNECRSICTNGESRTTQRALGFFLRYMCSVARRK